MRKTACCILIMAMVGLYGCSMPPVGRSAGVGVMFDDDPLVFDSSVVYMGTVVGRMLSQERGNGITRVLIVLDDQYEDLKKTNMAVVVKSGQIHLRALGGFGQPMTPDACILGFSNSFSYRWFKFKHLFNNVILAANQRAQALQRRSGLTG
jgi:hypothetical protein